MVFQIIYKIKLTHQFGNKIETVLREVKETLTFSTYDKALNFAEGIKQNNYYEGKLESYNIVEVDK